MPPASGLFLNQESSWLVTEGGCVEIIVLNFRFQVENGFDEVYVRHDADLEQVELGQDHCSCLAPGMEDSFCAINDLAYLGLTK